MWFEMHGVSRFAATLVLGVLLLAGAASAQDDPDDLLEWHRQNLERQVADQAQRMGLEPPPHLPLDASLRVKGESPSGKPILASVATRFLDGWHRIGAEVTRAIAAGDGTALFQTAGLIDEFASEGARTRTALEALLEGEVYV